MGTLNFREFLEGYGAFDKFVRNAAREYGIRPFDTVILCDENMPEDWVNDAFEWAETPEGHGFWMDIHEEWTWAHHVAMAKGDSVETGFPLFDPLGLQVLAVAVEDDDEGQDSL